MDDILITDHLKRFDFDIRKKPQGYSRFMDQKVTPDVLCFISDCIVNLVNLNGLDSVFNSKDIWSFPYFVKNTMAVFGKPSPENDTAGSEYDKFIAQPLKTLAFSKVLEETKVDGKNSYMVNNIKLLEFVSQNERNSLSFLAGYLEKVLKDSGFYGKFEEYKGKCLSGKVIENDLQNLREQFRKFMHGYTLIKKDLEINRIFPKVLNPLASINMVRGIERGKMTKGRYIYSDLMYNRLNFRDIGKEKTLSRQESVSDAVVQETVNKYRVAKAKNIIRRYHSVSEVKDSLATGKATQVHHIFSDSEFSEISDYVENLILLTPQQHNTLAHLNNKTTSVNTEYQKECLLSKIVSIKSSLAKGDFVYSKEKLIHVINTGYGLNLSTSTNFDELVGVIRAR